MTKYKFHNFYFRSNCDQDQDQSIRFIYALFQNILNITNFGNILHFSFKFPLFFWNFLHISFKIYFLQISFILQIFPLKRKFPSKWKRWMLQEKLGNHAMLWQHLALPARKNQVESKAEKNSPPF